LTERVARANFAGSRAHLSGMPLRRVVFVVDDEPTIGRTLKVILDQSGFEAMAFEDPLAAIVATVELAPDALIADVVMPKMNASNWLFASARYSLSARFFSFPDRQSPLI
jgi:PleD family two-component response regulator